MRNAALALSGMLCTLWFGCGGDDVEPFAGTYDTCSSTNDCLDARDGCIAVESSTSSGTICTRPCGDDADCPGASACESGICLATCSSDSACPFAWSCQDELCLPGQERGSVPTYEPCATFADCGDAADNCLLIVSGASSDSVCTRSCARDTDCPGVGSCESAVCLDTCTSDANCISGWSCQAGACLPGTGASVPSYGDCVSDDECVDAADFCTDVLNDDVSRSMCTRGCDDTLDCPGVDSRCVDFGGGGVCFDGCSVGSCVGGWGCYEPVRDVLICLPGPGGDLGIPAYDECFELGEDPGDCSTFTGGCFTISTSSATAGVCTSLCDTGDDCPVDSRGVQGLCVGFPAQPTTCFESCFVDAECASGFFCDPVSTGGPTVCLPG